MGMGSPAIRAAVLTPRGPSYAAYQVYDSFTGVNGTALEAHSPERGGAWASGAGSYTISGGALQVPTTFANVYFIDAGAADVLAEMDTTFPASAVPTIVTRYLDASNFWLVAYNMATQTLQIYERAAAANTLRASASFTIVASTTHTLGVRVTGTLIEALFDGVVVASYATMATGAGRTKVGVRQSGAVAYAVATFRALVGAGTVATTWPGVWTWYNDPRVLALSDRIAVGAVTRQGDVQALDYRPALGRFVGLQALKLVVEVDDHDNPAFLRRASDGRIMAFYAKHQQAPSYLRISTNADDLSAWGSEVDLDSQLGLATYAYANPVQLTGEVNTPIYLFFRGDNGVTGYRQWYSVSTDNGATWAAATLWLTAAAARPYLKLVRNGTDRIDFFFTDGHPEELVPTSCYHGYYQGGNLYKSDGTLVGALSAGPYTAAQFTLVWDGATANSWVHQVLIDPLTNRPVVVYATFVSHTDHRYRYARWTGSAWDDHEVCTAGSYLYSGAWSYSGGVCLDPSDTSIVYASRDTGDGIHQIWRYVTADGGTNWTGTQLTSNAAKSARPFAVAGTLFYWTGTYTSWTDYDTRIAALAT